jgi:hypothetical protein
VLRDLSEDLANNRIGAIKRRNGIGAFHPKQVSRTKGDLEMYEHLAQPLLGWPAFRRRALNHVVAGVAVVAIVDAIGTVGYHALGSLPWIDAFLNASMILGGMGPVDRLDTSGAKVFAGLYALFSGLVFVAVMAVTLGPWVHRLLHRLHVVSR